MATEVGGTGTPLSQALYEEPYRFDFFQAVRLLQRWRPHGAALGRVGPAGDEAVRVQTRQGLSFPASAVHQLKPPGRAGGPATLVVNFLGLTGPSGVLPHVYSELLWSRSRAGDQGPEAFLDLLNHRVVSLFYRAWEKHQVALQAERGQGDRIAGHLFALMGLGLPGARERHSFLDRLLLKYAGHFASNRRPAAVLEGLLRDQTGLPVEVVQFQPRWYRFDEADRSTLSSRSRRQALGRGLVLGRGAWDGAGAVRLRLGPLSAEEFRDHLPERPRFQALTELARLFLGAWPHIEVQLVLKAPDVPRCRLSTKRDLAMRLGRDSWLVGRPAQRDSDDAVFPSAT